MNDFSWTKSNKIRGNNLNDVDSRVRKAAILHPSQTKSEVGTSSKYFCEKYLLADSVVSDSLSKPFLSLETIVSLIHSIRDMEATLELAKESLKTASNEDRELLKVCQKKLCDQSKRLLEKTVLSASKNSAIEPLIAKVAIYVRPDETEEILQKTAHLFQNSTAPIWQRVQLKKLAAEILGCDKKIPTSEALDTFISYCEGNSFITELGVYLANPHFLAKLSKSQLKRCEELLGNDDNRDMLEILDEVGSVLDSSEEIFSQKAEVFISLLTNDSDINRELLAIKKSKKDLSASQKRGLDAALALSYKFGPEQQKVLQTVDAKLSHILSVVGECIELPQGGDLSTIRLTQEQIAALENRVVPENRKINLQEIGVLDGLGSLRPLLSNLELQTDPLGPNQQLFSAAKTVLVKANVLSRVLNLSMNSCSGDLSFSNLVLRQKMKASELKFMQQLQRFVTATDYYHGAILVKASNGISSQAHVLGRFEQAEVQLLDLVRNEFFRIDWDKLLTNEGKNVLKKACQLAYKRGKLARKMTPKELMQQFYQEEFEKVLHQGDALWREQFTNEADDGGRRILSVFKSMIVNSPDQQDSFSAYWEIKPSLLEQKGIFCTEFQMKITAFCWAKAVKRAADFIHNKNSPLQIARHAISHPLVPLQTQFSALHPGRAFRMLEPYLEKIAQSPLLKLFVQSTAP